MLASWSFMGALQQALAKICNCSGTQSFEQQSRDESQIPTKGKKAKSLSKVKPKVKAKIKPKPNTEPKSVAPKDAKDDHKEDINRLNAELIEFEIKYNLQTEKLKSLHQTADRYNEQLKQNQKLQYHYNALQTKYNELLKQNQMLQSHYDTLQTQCNQLKINLSQTKSQNNEQLKQNQILQTQCQQLIVKSTQTEANINLLNEKLKSLNEITDRYNAQLKQNQTLQSHYVTLQTQCNQLKINLSQTKAQYDQQLKQNQILQTQCKQLIVKSTQTETNINLLNEKLKSLNQTTDRYNTQLKQNQTLQSNFDTLKTQCDQLKINLLQMTLQYEEQLKQNQTLQSTFDASQTECNQLKINLFQTKSQYDEQLKQNQTLQSNFDALQTQCNQLKIKSLNQTICAKLIKSENDKEKTSYIDSIPHEMPHLNVHMKRIVFGWCRTEQNKLHVQITIPVPIMFIIASFCNINLFGFNGYNNWFEVNKTTEKHYQVKKIEHKQHGIILFGNSLKQNTFKWSNFNFVFAFKVHNGDVNLIFLPSEFNQLKGMIQKNDIQSSNYRILTLKNKHNYNYQETIRVEIDMMELCAYITNKSRNFNTTMHLKGIDSKRLRCGFYMINPYSQFEIVDQYWKKKDWKKNEPKYKYVKSYENSDSDQFDDENSDSDEFDDEFENKSQCETKSPQIPLNKLGSGLNYIGNCSDHLAVCNQGFGENIRPDEYYALCNQCNQSFDHQLLILHDCAYYLSYKLQISDAQKMNGVAYPDPVDIYADIFKNQHHVYLKLDVKNHSEF